MKKRIISFLILTCLLVGLFPVTGLAEAQIAKILIMGDQELTVTEGGAPAYLKNKEFDAANVADGTTTFKAWTQEPGDADNWNVKFEWPIGSTPTITLKDAKMDYYDNETTAYVYLKQSDGSYASTAPRRTTDPELAENLLISAIMPVAGYNFDLTLVLEGDNLVETGNGFILGNPVIKSNETDTENHTYDNAYFKNVTITSVKADGQTPGNVVANGGSIGIMCKPGYDLSFIDAHVKLTTKHTGSNATPVHVTDGDITIIGGELNVTNLNNLAICAFNSGNIFINGNVTVQHKLSGTAAPAGIYAKGGTITINGGTITGTSQNAPIINGKKTIINGGHLILTSGWIAIYAESAGDVEINGGTIEITANRAFNRIPKVADNVNGYAGPNFKDAEPYEDALCDKPWLILSDQPLEAPPSQQTDPTTLPTTAPTTEPTTVPTVAPTTAPTVVPTTVPTTAATQATTAATAATQATTPATAATTATEGTTATTDQAPEEDNSGNATVIIIVIAAVLVVGIAAAIIVKKKK